MSRAQDFKTQSELAKHLEKLEGAKVTNDWRDISVVLDELAGLDPDSVLNPGIAVRAFQSILSSSAITLTGPIRLKFYLLFNAYAFAFWNKNDIVDKDLIANWKAQIAGLLTWVGTSGHTKENLPYLHAYQYHLTCAEAATKLIVDTHQVDIAEHARNLASIAGSF